MCRGQIDNAKPEDGGIIAKSGYLWLDAVVGIKARSKEWNRLKARQLHDPDTVDLYFLNALVLSFSCPFLVRWFFVPEKILNRLVDIRGTYFSRTSTFPECILVGEATMPVTRRER